MTRCMTINKIRRMENLPDVPDGDELYVSLTGQLERDTPPTDRA